MLCWSINSLHGQSLNTAPVYLNVSTYGERDGLLWNDYTGAVIKDKDGFIWIPTDRGLYRFDGTNFKNYRHDPANKNSLPTNHVGWIYQDRQGRYWCYLEETGLFRFNPLTQAFNSLPQR